MPAGKRGLVPTFVLVFGVAVGTGGPSLAHAQGVPAKRPAPKTSSPLEKQSDALDAALVAVGKGDRRGPKAKEQRKKLETALLACKGCSAARRGAAQLVLGVAFADAGEDKDAAKHFAEALKIDGTVDLGDHDSPLRTPAAERAYALAREKAKLPPQARPEPPPPPDRAVVAAAEAPVTPLTTVGGATFTPGFGLVAGGFPEKPATPPKSTLTVPRTSAATHTHWTTSFALGYVLLRPKRDNQGPVGSLADTTGPRLDFGLGYGIGFDDAKWFRPSIGVDVGAARPSQDTQYFLLPQGDQQFWMLSARAKLSLGLAAGPLSVTPHAGGFIDYYAPADTVPGDTKGASLSGYLYGGTVGLHGGSVGASVGYSFEKGPEQLARKRRIEVRLSDVIFFWEAREKVTGAFDVATKPTYAELLAASMPLTHHYGMLFRW